MVRLGFFVAAPTSQIERGVFRNLVTNDTIRQRVQDRVAAYRGNRDEWFDQWSTPAIGSSMTVHNGPKTSS